MMPALLISRLNPLRKLILILGLLFLFNSAYGSQESFLGLAYLEKEPWKMVWANDSESGWKITTSFEKAHVTYFFKKGPSKEKGLNLSSDNPPYKIVFKDLVTDQSFTITEIAYEQWEDGAKTYAGRYKGNFSILGEKFDTIIVSVVEEVNGAKDSADYFIWKVQ